MQKIAERKSYKIQVLRGLAIIAVVFIHQTPPGMAQIWVRPFVNFAVGMFLFLSGMLSNSDRWNPKKRILKIIIPYLIWTFIHVLMGNYNNPSHIPLAYIHNLITAESASVMYYVFVYCEFTLLIPIIDKLARSKFKWIGFLISPIEILLMRLLPIVLGFELNEYISIIMSISCLGWFTYFYLGYMLGNGLIKIKTSTSKLLIMWTCSIALQILEGYWYHSAYAIYNGSQLKLTSILSGTLFVLLAYKYLNADNKPAPKLLHFLGDISFGIFFAHEAIMPFLNKIPYYSKIAIFPLNALITLAVTSLFVFIGKKLLGKYAKYFAL